MAQRVQGSLVLPSESPLVPPDGYAMCAAPALARAASLQDPKTPFRSVAIVCAHEVGADSVGSPPGLQTVDATPFIGFEPGKWWGGKIPVLLGPPPGLPANTRSSFYASLSRALQPATPYAPMAEPCSQRQKGPSSLGNRCLATSFLKCGRAISYE